MAGSGNRPTARLFLALWPPAPVREALHALQARWSWPDEVALVPAARLHLTLHFLGAVPMQRLDEFAAGLDVPFEPFELPLAAATPRVWPGGIAVLEWPQQPALASLHDRLGQALRSLGWPVEARPLRPHVTLARRARGASSPARALPAPAWKVDDGYALVRSSPREGYALLQMYPR